MKLRSISVGKHDAQMIHLQQQQRESLNLLEKSLMSPIGDSIIVDDGVNLYVSKNNIAAANSI